MTARRVRRTRRRRHDVDLSADMPYYTTIDPWDGV